MWRGRKDGSGRDPEHPAKRRADRLCNAEDMNVQRDGRHQGGQLSAEASHDLRRSNTEGTGNSGPAFETAIIERYRRKRYRFEEAWWRCICAGIRKEVGISRGPMGHESQFGTVSD